MSNIVALKKFSQKQKPEYLWWEKEGKPLKPAGIAFYNESFGEYHLKVDNYPNNEYYLRPIGLENDVIEYRLVLIKKRNGRFFKKVSVGEGRQGNIQGANIEIEWYHLPVKMLLSTNRHGLDCHQGESESSDLETEVREAA